MPDTPARPWPDSLPAVAVHVLDGLPDAPATFTAADVVDLLAAAREARVEGAGSADVAGVLDALASAEMVQPVGGRYVVVTDARPF